MNATNIYRVQGPTNTHISPTPGNATSTAECDTGDVLLNGGLNASGRFHILDDAQPLANGTNDVPVSYIGSLFGTEAQVTSVAFCFDNPPTR